MTVAQLQRRIGWQLLSWALASCAVGLMLVGRGGFWGDFGLQALVWGAVDLVIAALGLRQAPPVDAARALARLRRLLMINAGLDVLYLLAGAFVLWLAPAARGHGAGILVQGGFLLLFDSYHAWGSSRRLALELGL